MAKSTSLSLYGEIAKFDADGESLLVSGILSTPAKDKQGEEVTADAMRKALGDYLLNGTCREMHQPIAAGKTLSGFVDDDGKTHITVKVVDKGTITKIKEGVLKGFSIGGKALKKVGNKITELLLREASLVDVPANPECVFELVKFDKPEDRCSDPECEHHVEGHMKKCASCMAKSKSSEKSMKKTLCKVAGLPEDASDEALEKALIEKLSRPAPAPDAAAAAILAKMDALTTQVTDLAKTAKDATEKAVEVERKTVIQKMEREGRYAVKEGGVAYTVDELQKMDMGLLKVLAVNSPKLPIQANSVFKGTGAGPTGGDYKGFQRIEAHLEQTLGRNLSEMNANHGN